MQRDELLRVFVALPLDNHAIKALSNTVSTLRSTSEAHWRWVTESNLHLTLRFLCTITPARLNTVVVAAKQVAANSSSLQLSLDDIGVFPSWQRPSVLWIGVGGDIQPLKRMAQQLEAVLVDAGFPAADKPFKPHITLARSKAGIPTTKEAFSSSLVNHPIKWVADNLVVFQSELRPQGPVYTPLRVCTLGDISQ
jgi:2'-5' RNA ligase